MKLVNKNITLIELKEMSEKTFNKLVKAVVDIEKKIMVVDAELHADEEDYLLNEEESEQQNLWGINLYPQNFKQEGWIEFDSMINLRPSFGNKSRSVDNPEVREKIINIVNRLVADDNS